MKNYTDLKSSQLTARKEKDIKLATFLSTLMGEIELESKRSTNDINDITLAVATKFKKNIEQNLALVPSDDLNRELTIINEYVPVALDEFQIKEIIQDMVAINGKDMKVIMPKLKAIAGMDMKLASQILKEV